MDVYKVALLGVCGVMLGRFFCGWGEEFALYVGLSTGLLILLLAAGRLSRLWETVCKMETYLSVDPAYMKILLKMLAVAYIGQFAASLCKDAGNSAVAGQIELFCKLTLAALCAPVLLTLLEVITGFLSL